MESFKAISTKRYASAPGKNNLLDIKKSISFIMEFLHTAFNKYHGSKERGRRETQHKQQWTGKQGSISLTSLGLREREEFEQDSVYILKPIFVFFLRMLLSVLKMIICTFLITFALSYLSDTLRTPLFSNQVQEFEPKKKNVATKLSPSLW